MCKCASVCTGPWARWGGQLGNPPRGRFGKMDPKSRGRGEAPRIWTKSASESPHLDEARRNLHLLTLRSRIWVSRGAGGTEFRPKPSPVTPVTAESWATGLSEICTRRPSPELAPRTYPTPGALCALSSRHNAWLNFRPTPEAHPTGKCVRAGRSRAARMPTPRPPHDGRCINPGAGAAAAHNNLTSCGNALWCATLHRRGLASTRPAVHNRSRTPQNSHDDRTHVVWAKHRERERENSPAQPSLAQPRRAEPSRAVSCPRCAWRCSPA